MVYSETFVFHPYPPPFFPSPFVSFATINWHTNVCFWFTLHVLPPLSLTMCPRDHVWSCVQLSYPLMLHVVSLCGRSMILIQLPPCGSCYFQTLLVFYSHCFRGCLLQSLHRAARVHPKWCFMLPWSWPQRLSLVLWCCPSPVLGPLWSHRQIILLLGPSLFGAGFLIVGLTVCSCPAGSRQVEHLRPCS